MVLCIASATTFSLQKQTFSHREASNAPAQQRSSGSSPWLKLQTEWHALGEKAKKLPGLVLEESAVAGGLPVIPVAAPACWLQEALAFSLRPWLPGICNHREFKPCLRDRPPIPAWRKKLRSWGSWPPSCPRSPTLPLWFCGFWSKQKPLYG